MCEQGKIKIVNYIDWQGEAKADRLMEFLLHVLHHATIDNSCFQIDTEHPAYSSAVHTFLYTTDQDVVVDVPQVLLCLAHGMMRTTPSSELRAFLLVESISGCSTCKVPAKSNSF